MGKSKNFRPFVVYIHIPALICPQILLSLTTEMHLRFPALPVMVLIRWQYQKSHWNCRGISTITHHYRETKSLSKLFCSSLTREQIYFCAVPHFRQKKTKRHHPDPEAVSRPENRTGCALVISKKPAKNLLSRPSKSILTAVSKKRAYSKEQANC